jgi:hypothetical protein
MDSRDQRYGWAADDPRWTDAPAGATSWDSDDDEGFDPETLRRFYAGAYDSDDERRTTTGPLAIAGSPEPSPANLPAVQSGYGRVVRTHTGSRSLARTSGTSRDERAARRDARVRRRRRSAEDEFRRTSRAEIFGEEPRYSALFGLTAAWYGLPVVLFLIWLLFGEQGSGAQIVASLPWLLTALGLSIAVAGLLRWAVVGWRAMTLSFAGAVIGAGVATIAHSIAV